MLLTRSPLAPSRFPEMKPIDGVRLSAVRCGLKKDARLDLTLAELVPATTVAGVFSRSQTAAAAVDWCRSQVGTGRARGLAVHAGNANAFTGRAGARVVERIAGESAGLIGCSASEVFVAATGVIGEPIPDDRILNALPEAYAALAPTPWESAAHAISTTDTFPKGATRTAKIADTVVTINGIAKGSGMIMPDMATMLAFVFTDAALPASVAQALLRRSAARSFNCITVDSDTSTSDTVLLFATGMARHAPIADPADRALRDFRRKLDEVMLDLAQQIVRDGEGASKFITVNVGGAASAQAARRIAFAVANSPLVKTAVAGADPNWGRVVMAVGKSGEKVDRDRLRITLGGVTAAENGNVHPGYDERLAAQHVAGSDVVIGVDVGVGRGKATVWTCDLTHAYIDINAHYRS